MWRRGPSLSLCAGSGGATQAVRITWRLGIQTYGGSARAQQEEMASFTLDDAPTEGQVDAGAAASFRPKAWRPHSCYITCLRGRVLPRGRSCLDPSTRHPSLSIHFRSLVRSWKSYSISQVPVQPRAQEPCGTGVGHGGSPGREASRALGGIARAASTGTSKAAGIPPAEPDSGTDAGRDPPRASLRSFHPRRLSGPQRPSSASSTLWRQWDEEDAAISGTWESSRGACGGSAARVRMEKFPGRAVNVLKSLHSSALTSPASHKKVPWSSWERT
ncbi:hypothetical protein J0S82_001991 [Galemys pyrenaicus]|uniref:Uncharacterized protein n=1 Tax=Galemys pyrenaicus TaxID=202257 RepID=A0A8J6ALK9_GALPY|nr:hypothetical protein J0S82_001991 [Galemys pyrenaicus]